MKKIFVVLLFLTIPLMAASTESADYFSFSMGAGGGYDFVTDSVSGGIAFGLDYQFNDQFSGGFKFFQYGTDVTAVNITMYPVDSLSVSLYTGSDGTDVVFGVGAGYDFFTKKDGLFSSMGVFIDWMAGVAGAYNVADGGLLTFGMKTKFGI